MRTFNLILGFVLTFSLALAAAGPVHAAQDPAPLTGVVQDVTLLTDPVTEEVTVQVTLDTATGEVMVVIGLQDARTLGLVTLGPGTQGPAVNADAIGREVTIAPDMLVPDEADGEPTGEHPIIRLLADFFGVEYDLIADLHTDGFGFGVIAESCWASYRLAGDASLCGEIAAAKRSGDYSAITLPDGSTPTNWGQFKQALKAQRSVVETLGAIRSGRAGEQAGDVEQPAKDKNDRPPKNTPPGRENKDNKGKSNRPNK